MSKKYKKGYAHGLADGMSNHQEIELLSEIGTLLEDVEYKGSYADAVRMLLNRVKELERPKSKKLDWSKWHHDLKESELSDVAYMRHYLKESADEIVALNAKIAELTGVCK